MEFEFLYIVEKFNLKHKYVYIFKKLTINY